MFYDLHVVVLVGHEKFVTTLSDNVAIKTEKDRSYLFFYFLFLEEIEEIHEILERSRIPYSYSERRRKTK